MAEVPTDHPEIKAKLGHIIPCYGEAEGCCADDQLNEEECTETGCAFLRVFKAGVEWAAAQSQG